MKILMLNKEIISAFGRRYPKAKEFLQDSDNFNRYIIVVIKALIDNFTII